MSSTPQPEHADARIRRDIPLSSELAPSVLRDDDLAVPRAVGTVAAAVSLFGAVALTMNLSGASRALDTGWSVVVIVIGFLGLLYHAAFDRDTQFRRLYLVLGLAALLFGTGLAGLSGLERFGMLLPWAIPTLLMGLLFYLCFHRNETDPSVRQIAQLGVAIFGAILAVSGLSVAILQPPFFLPTGFVMSLSGLVLLAGWIGSAGSTSDEAHMAAFAMAGFGAMVVAVVLIRTVSTETGSTFFVNTGYPMVMVALLYIIVGLGLALDWPLFVLTRRELAAFFVSPVAYICLLAFCFFAWIAFQMFLGIFKGSPGNPSPSLPEPVLANYIISLFPVFTLLVVVPVLTMRLLSEEQRAGTLEVLLTAPVDEPVVVLSKFFAGLVMYVVMWLPYFLFLLAIPAYGAPMFDYRPMFSFSLAMLVTGAMFISLGVFCSSLTSSQIGSGMLTFGGMLLLTFSYFLERLLGPEYRDIISHMSYLHAWSSALEGRVVLREFLFPLSATVVFLYMTVKVLESRKWR